MRIHTLRESKKIQGCPITIIKFTTHKQRTIDPAERNLRSSCAPPQRKSSLTNCQTKWAFNAFRIITGRAKKLIIEFPDQPESEIALTSPGAIKDALSPSELKKELDPPLEIGERFPQFPSLATFLWMILFLEGNHVPRQQQQIRS